MSVPLTSAVEEAERYLTFFQAVADGVTTQQLAEYPWPPLTVGAIRAMYELAKDVCDTAGAYSAEELERVTSRKR